MSVAAMRIALAVMALLMLPPLSAAAPPTTAVADPGIVKEATSLLHDPASPVLGNPHGDVAVIEFFDYACHYCKAVEPRLEMLLKSDKGVKLILKEFPILTPESVTATKAALAAARQGKYAQFHQALMNYRGSWETSAIFDTAHSVGLDVDRLRKDMDAPEIADEISANLKLARSLGISETPSLIVGTHLLSEPSAQIDFPKVVAAARIK